MFRTCLVSSACAAVPTLFFLPFSAVCRRLNLCRIFGPLRPAFPRPLPLVQAALSARILRFYLTRGELTGEHSRSRSGGLPWQCLLGSFGFARYVRHCAGQLGGGPSCRRAAASHFL